MAPSLVMGGSRLICMAATRAVSRAAMVRAAPMVRLLRRRNSLVHLLQRQEHAKGRDAFSNPWQGVKSAPLEDGVAADGVGCKGGQVEVRACEAAVPTGGMHARGRAAALTAARAMEGEARWP